MALRLTKEVSRECGAGDAVRQYRAAGGGLGPDVRRSGAGGGALPGGGHPRHNHHEGCERQRGGERRGEPDGPRSGGRGNGLRGGQQCAGGRLGRGDGQVYCAADVSGRGPQGPDGRAAPDDKRAGYAGGRAGGRRDGRRRVEEEWAKYNAMLTAMDCCKAAQKHY